MEERRELDDSFVDVEEDLEVDHRVVILGEPPMSAHKRKADTALVQPPHDLGSSTGHLAVKVEPSTDVTDAAIKVKVL